MRKFYNNDCIFNTLMFNTLALQIFNQFTPMITKKKSKIQN